MERIAVVTGARGGLGSHLCRLIAKAGWGLVLVDHDCDRETSRAFLAELERTFPGAVRDTHDVDLASHDDIARLIADVLAAHPRIDALFNNAGVLTETLQLSQHGNELHFEINTLAPLQLIDGLRPALRAAGNAVVVNTSAGAARTVKTLAIDGLVKPECFAKLHGPYAASKAALGAISLALARDVAPDGIVVRGADPGPNRTPLSTGAGTPGWMRPFARILPTPQSGAKRIFDVAFASQWIGRTGIVVSGGSVAALPPAIASQNFTDELLRACRARAAMR
ncbi:MAG: hypothetical protein PVSMB8_03270 [Vulcanimicrobiaceae bacterium]